MGKVIKDPIYGYLEFSDEEMNVIDTVYFQRLRNIIQTSYSPLYPSSLHNRFSHSLGVCYLGKRAFSSLEKNGCCKGIDSHRLEQIKNDFILACLCHDLGHAPFSHTSETFFDRKKFSELLDKEINDSEYTNDLQMGEKITGKAHEIVSALLALRVFSSQIIDKSFFARCIIGLNYQVSISNQITSLKRACVELLNSEILDIDKLDYIIRDSYMSGYSSVSIDYERLLNGLYISTLNINRPIGFKKGALSVLESVLEAHDMEKRWVQSHPVILYESYLLQVIISKELRNRDALFCLETLLPTGRPINDGDYSGCIRLLSDSDIIHLAKNHYNDDNAVGEYFNRSLRRHPIWKTEAEYRYFFNKYNASGINEKLFQILKNWNEHRFLSGEREYFSINDSFYHQLYFESKQEKSDFGKQYDMQIRILDCLKNFCNKHNILFDLVIITQDQFKSNIENDSFKHLPIGLVMDGDAIIVEKTMEEVEKDKRFFSSSKEEFFYMFYKTTLTNKIDQNKKDIEILKDVNSLVDGIQNAILA